jgi:inorganic pyrophosphatase
MNIWHDIDPAEITPTDFTAVIEIPKGSNCKYELDKKNGMRRLDRILYTATHYPANYGFIPRTYADDGDPLDVLIICAEPIYPMTLVQVYPFGCMRMIDSGKLDDKIIAIAFSDPTYSGIQSIHELPPHIFDEIMHFFTVYKQLENKQTAGKELFRAEEAQQIIADCIRSYQEKFVK